MQILDFEAYLAQMLSVPRPGSEKILAFYEHRVGGICKDARLLLAPLDDHLCHRGDGVFESISYRKGRMFQLDAHMERMQNSSRGLGIEPPCSWQEIRAIILAVAAAGGCEDGAIRILIGRGPGGFGISPTECPMASLYVVAIKSATPKDDWYKKGLRACRSSVPAKQAYLAKIKNANYLPNVLMAEEARLRGVDVAFSFTEKGYLAEAAVANVGIVTQKGLLACPPFEHALPGTTLLAALECAKGFMPTEFQDISEEDIWAAKEVLLFGSSPLCVGVSHYEGRAIGNGGTGSVAAHLRQSLLQKLWDEGDAF